jgi:hypothetical protein
VNLCACGCGGRTRKQWVRGHNIRVKNPGVPRYGADNHVWRGEAVGYRAAHTRHLKTRKNVCEECGEHKRTTMALIHGRGDRADIFGVRRGRLYSIKREDYRELCYRCHNRYDAKPNSHQKAAHTRFHEGPFDACERCHRDKVLTS